MPRPVDHHDRLDGRGRLGRLEAAGRREPLGVPERQPLERHVLDELARRRIALNHEEPLDHRRDHLGLGHVLARQRLVVERAVAGQEPLAGRVQRRAKILQVVARVALPRVPRLHPLAAGDQRVPLGVQRDR